LIFVGHSLFSEATSKVSNADLDIDQIDFQENRCSGRLSIFCSGFSSNEVVVGTIVSAPSDAVISVSNLDADLEQRFFDNNQCNTDIICDNFGRNIVGIGAGVFFVSLSDPITIEKYNIDGIDANIHQELIRNN
jgi:hypothetical protein